MGGRTLILPSGQMTIGDVHADSEYISSITSSFEFHHTRMREQNEEGVPHAASMAETFATMRAIPIGRGLERSSRAKLPIGKMVGNNEE